MWEEATLWISLPSLVFLLYQPQGLVSEVFGRQVSSFHFYLWLVREKEQVLSAALFTPAFASISWVRRAPIHALLSACLTSFSLVKKKKKKMGKSFLALDFCPLSSIEFLTMWLMHMNWKQIVSLFIVFMFLCLADNFHI